MKVLLVDALILLGAALISVAVFGIRRLPDPFARIHAANTAASGVVVVLVAAIVHGSTATALRAGLALAFVLLTSPASAHILARLEHHRRKTSPDP